MNKWRKGMITLDFVKADWMLPTNPLESKDGSYRSTRWPFPVVQANMKEIEDAWSYHFGG
jgi:hypothetical protein